MSAPVALSVERYAVFVERSCYKVRVAVGVDVYSVKTVARPGATLVLGTRTKTGRKAAYGNRRADIERCAIDAVQL
jgi:hypothetical protein